MELPTNDAELAAFSIQLHAAAARGIESLQYFAAEVIAAGNRAIAVLPQAKKSPGSFNPQTKMSV
jgi:hypothetical protein